MSDKPEMSEPLKSAASKLFDIRLLIGGLFVVYGVILTIYGFLANQAEIAKAAGINMNRWLGLGMLILGIIFLVWRKLDPGGGHAEPNPTDVDGIEGGRPMHH